MQARTGQFWTYIRGEIAKNRDVTDLKDLAAKRNALRICSTYLESSRQHRVRSLDVCTLYLCYESHNHRCDFSAAWYFMRSLQSFPFE